MDKPTYETDDQKMFLHCKKCLEKFWASERHKKMSAQEAMSYEASSYRWTFPDGHVENIMVLWCKNCHEQVWDTRHLVPKK